MKRVTISLRNETAKDLDSLSAGIGCSRSALVEVLLARGLLKRLRARLDYLHMETGGGSTARRMRGDSIQEIEETIDYLENNYQGELWDADDEG